MTRNVILQWFEQCLSCLMTKPTKWHVRPAKTQISLGNRPVWSESSLPVWRKFGSLATHWANSEDSDQTGRMPRRRLQSDGADAQADLNLRWAHMPFCWFCHEAAHLTWGVVSAGYSEFYHFWNGTPIIFEKKIRYRYWLKFLSVFAYLYSLQFNV